MNERGKRMGELITNEFCDFEDLRLFGTHPFMDVRLMNQDKADLANECHACNGMESDLSADFIRKISAVLSG